MIKKIPDFSTVFNTGHKIDMFKMALYRLELCDFWPLVKPAFYRKKVPPIT